MAAVTIGVVLAIGSGGAGAIIVVAVLAAIVVLDGIANRRDLLELPYAIAGPYRPSVHRPAASRKQRAVPGA